MRLLLLGIISEWLNAKCLGFSGIYVILLDSDENVMELI